MTEDRVRVLRILEYEGPRSWVEAVLAQRSVKGCKSFMTTDGEAVIREATIGEAPAILSHDVEDTVVDQYPLTNYQPCEYPECDADLGHCAARCAAIRGVKAS